MSASHNLMMMIFRVYCSCCRHCSGDQSRQGSCGRKNIVVIFFLRSDHTEGGPGGGGNIWVFLVLLKTTKIHQSSSLFSLSVLLLLFSNSVKLVKLKLRFDPF
jgi:hypothetical protein